MDTYTLSNFMKRDVKTSKFFRGVYPSDLLPKQLKRESLYVINLSPSGTEGSHWVLLSTIHPDYSAYICSLGMKPSLKNVLDSLFSVSNVIVYNDYKNQDSLATTCGWHVIFTASMLSRGHDLADVMSNFYTESPYINDNAVLEIISTNFNVKELVPTSDWNFIFSKYK